VTTLTKARLLYLLGMASVFGFHIVANCFRPGGLSDGGFW
jgi:hypothetical protein